MRQLDDGQLAPDDILDFVEMLQIEADDLAVLWTNTPPGMERFEIMQAICVNAYRQSQLRAWLSLILENKCEKTLYNDIDIE